MRDLKPRTVRLRQLKPAPLQRAVSEPIARRLDAHIFLLELLETARKDEAAHIEVFAG